MLQIVLGYSSYQENSSFNAASKKIMPSEEDRLAITELFNKKQALLLELQHYEANAASALNTDVEIPSNAMPTNTKLQVAVLPSCEQVRFTVLQIFLY